MEEQYSSFFKKLTGFLPYNFQMNLAKSFTAKKNTILQAPTGSGKTWASISPFIYCWKEWKEEKQNPEDYPRKLIYSLPLRTLANSLYKEVSTKIKDEFPELKISVKLQTGEFPDDIFFEGDIIFTTIDQTLSNILGIPLSLPSKLANINAGAVLESYLIFDEFHLLDPKASLSTTITLLEVMKNINQFCLMTATLSNTFLQRASKYLDSKVVIVNKNDYRHFEFVKNNVERFVMVKDNVISAEEIIKKHKLKTIVICNTVDRCVQIFKELLDEKEAGGINAELICIHSRFFQKHRKEKEKRILELFSKKSNIDVILVSTQVIEVGLDISCDIMHTEISPVNSFLQRIGRCARWSGKGEIFVYDVPEKKRKYLPYKSELCKSTFLELSKINNEKLDYYLSQDLIENILGKFEENIFDEVINSAKLTWDSISDSWCTSNKAFARELIRDISSISLVFLPEYYQTDSLYKYESISMNPYSIRKKINYELESFEGETPTFVMSLEESNFDFDETKELVRITPNQILNENIVAINCNIVGYSSEFGIDFTGTGGYQSKVTKIEEKFKYTILMDTYEQHIRWMLSALNKMYSINFSLNKIQNIRYKNFDFESILKYIIIIHDYGKLNILWQNIVNDYQKEKSKSNNGDFNSNFLAHTDYDPNSKGDLEMMKKIFKEYKVRRKPSHAGIGAFLTKCILPFLLKMEKNSENHSLLKVVITTIARHHSANTKTFPEYEIDNDAISLINDKLMKSIIPKFQISDVSKFPFSKYSKGNLESDIIQFNNKIETFLYFILVRALRLCDQRSFAENNKLEKNNE